LGGKKKKCEKKKKERKAKLFTITLSGLFPFAKEKKKRWIWRPIRRGGGGRKERKRNDLFPDVLPGTKWQQGRKKKGFTKIRTLYVKRRGKKKKTHECVNTPMWLRRKNTDRSAA